MSELLSSLAECLKYERTICACFGGYHAYFKRWRIHRLEDWMLWNAKAACMRVAALEHEIIRQGGTPENEAYEFDLEMVDSAGDIMKVWSYFNTMLTEAIEAYRKAVDQARFEATTGALCGTHQAQLEDTLSRVEAKTRKVELIGPELYIAMHMHSGGGVA